MLTWDRTRDWVVHRHYHELTEVSVHFGAGGPSARELIALRNCLPHYRDTPPVELRRLVGQTLALGTMPTRAARPWMEKALAAGLNVVGVNASFVSYLPVDQTTGAAHLIEDDEQARALAEAMIAAGVPVVDIEG